MSMQIEIKQLFRFVLICSISAHKNPAFLLTNVGPSGNMIRLSFNMAAVLHKRFQNGGILKIFT